MEILQVSPPALDPTHFYKYKKHNKHLFQKSIYYKMVISTCIKFGYIMLEQKQHS